MFFGERDRSIDQSLAGMVKAWGGAGAWAAEAELADAASAVAKEREVSKGVGGVGGQDVFAFPSLGDAVSAKPQKKKKGQTFSLSEITVGKYVGPGGKARGAVVNDTTKLTTEEMMMLPTGPRARSDDEQGEVGALGGGFRDYGGNRGGGDRLDREERRDRGGFGLGFERDREGGGGGGGGGFGRDRERDDGPSRADEDAKWGASKKFVPSLGVGERGGGGDRGGGYEEDKRGGRVSDRDLPSRADEVDNWGSSKKFVPASQTLGGESNGERRIISGRSEERRGSAGYDEAPGGGLTSRADEVDNWVKGKKFVPSSTSSSRGFGFDTAAFKDAAAGPEADRWARRQPAPESEHRASERPRLKLQPRTLPVESSSPPPPARTHETDGGKDSLTVLEGSVSEELQQQLSAAAVSKHRPDPFAGARTQEQVLAEKGLDWRKIDANLDVSKEKPWRQGKQPSSGESSKPHTPPEKGVETAAKPPPLRTNPFGEARQQEVLLEAKGKDLDGSDADPEQHVA